MPERLRNPLRDPAASWGGAGARDGGDRPRAPIVLSDTAVLLTEGVTDPAGYARLVGVAS